MSSDSADERERIRATGVDTAQPSMSFMFHVSHAGIDSDAEALELTLRMLRFENGLRLAPETVARYAESQKDRHKSRVTQELQERVVQRFIDDPVAKRFFHDTATGLSFLRGHAGNFPSHYEKLKEAANYVRYTADCVPGSLSVGDVVPHSALANVTLAPMERCRDYVSLGDLIAADRHRPLLVVGSSAT